MTILTLALANTILDAALRQASALGTKPMTAVVIDAGGHLIALQRQDGASMFRADIAVGKAWAAIAMGVADSRALVKRAADNPQFFTALAAAGQGKFIPQTGALAIRDAEGVIVGAASASGGTGDEDEAVCAHGIAHAGLTR